MAEPFKLTRIPSLKGVEEFRSHCASLGIEIPSDDGIAVGADSPLLRPIENVTINGKQIGNRFAIQPMEGWDGTTTGGISDEMHRRWTRFGESGAKLIYGGEAMAVRADGRANPNQWPPSGASIGCRAADRFSCQSLIRGALKDLVQPSGSRSSASTSTPAASGNS